MWQSQPVVKFCAFIFVSSGRRLKGLRVDPRRFRVWSCFLQHQSAVSHSLMFRYSPSFWGNVTQVGRNLYSLCWSGCLLRTVCKKTSAVWKIFDRKDVQLRWNAYSVILPFHLYELFLHICGCIAHCFASSMYGVGITKMFHPQNDERCLQITAFDFPLHAKLVQQLDHWQNSLWYGHSVSVWREHHSEEFGLPSGRKASTMTVTCLPSTNPRNSNPIFTATICISLQGARVPWFD